MFTALLLLVQAVPAAPTPVPGQPCRLKGPRGKLVDVDPKLCEQSTWDSIRLPASAAGTSATTMELDIDEAGRVTDCRVVEPSGTPQLDAKACSIAIEKARYKPAIGPDGKAKRTSTRLKVAWPAHN
ncbi:energy transducer TonB [uncultured Sphingomonas sp.]|uniref:energy transducer TonB n=1 Tax=uncultured Sphingomonas sp. TaxID=158754 RepID=UPI0035C952C7